MTHSDTIMIFGVEESADRIGPFRTAAELKYGRREVAVRDLQTQVQHFLDSMREVLLSAPTIVGDFALNEITISAEVSAKGTVSLLGSGGEIAGKGALSFKLIRRAAGGGQPGTDQGKAQTQAS